MERYYKRENRYEFIYEFTKNGERITKTIYPKSKEKMNECKEKCKTYGYKVISVKKLYPFNTYANQHNFSLINDIVFCELHDIDMGDKKVSKEEYDRLESLKERSEKYFLKELPVAWVTWEEWKDMKEIAEMAIIHRQNACIENGRPDLVTYC